jgi:hypothetical protein
MQGGMQGRSFPQVLFAMAFAVAISYRGLNIPQSPVSDGTSPQCARNAQIRVRHEKGESIATLAEGFGITEQRIWQILNHRRKWDAATVAPIQNRRQAFFTATTKRLPDHEVLP